MYDKGYVLVSPHDMAIVNDDGTMSRGKIMVPKGKIPFVLSQDDVSYYHYKDGDGCASKLVLDEKSRMNMSKQMEVYQSVITILYRFWILSLKNIRIFLIMDARESLL